MKKTINAILMLLVGLLCVGALASCNLFKSPLDKVENESEEVIYSQNTKATLVLGSGINRSNVSLINSAYYEKFGKEIDVVSSSVPQSPHEIIVGKTSRELSEKAYRSLELLEREDGNVGFVIYSDGTSVALAFDDAVFGEDVALESAVEAFVQRYMQGDSLKLGKGKVYHETFEPIEKQAEKDQRTVDLLWDMKISQIAEKNGGDRASAEAIVAQLKKLYSVYNDDYSTVKWLANLYDPECGGFYYSNSARNNIGFLPDLESTSQALSIIEMMLSGYGGTMTDYLGDEIASGVISFAKDMQDPNGYFYHPQWTRELTDKNSDRRERDVFNAVSILGLFDEVPQYSTPNGITGEVSASSANKLTAPLATSEVISVSALASYQDALYVPNYLKTKESFESYLSGLDILTNTASVSRTLCNDVPLYLAIDQILEDEGKDYRLADILAKYLSRNQSITTGLWMSDGEDVSSAISELPDVIKIYDALSKPVTYFDKIINTVVPEIKALDNPNEIDNITDMWGALYSLIRNITAYSDEKEMELVDYYLGHLYPDFDSLIESTLSALVDFCKTDGSFSTLVGASKSEVLGMATALPGMNEGDMNATVLATKTLWLSVFGVLELGSVPIFTSSDRMAFQKTLLDMGVILKNEVKKVDPIDFEDYSVGDTPSIDYKFNSTQSSVKVVENPNGDGNAARLYSSSKKGSNYDYYFFKVMSSVGSATCYSYEFDMCVLPETSTDVFAHLYLYSDIYAIFLSRDGSTVRFYEHSSRTSSSSRTMDIGVNATVGEWFNLRVEYYTGPRGSVRIKIFYNGECVAVSDNYYGSHSSSSSPPRNTPTSFAVYGNSAKTMDVLIDNVAVETTYQTYTVETKKLNRNVDYPDKPQSIHSFEDIDVGEAPPQFVTSGTGASVRTDAEGNKLLALNEKIGEIILPLDARGSSINSALVEFDVILSENSKSGAKYQICFNEYKYDNTTFGSMFLIVKEENGSTYLTVADGISGSDGDAYEDIRLNVGEKHRVGLRLFFEQAVIVVTVDGKVVGINQRVSNVMRYCLGEIKLVSRTENVTSELLIDNVVAEKVAQDFEQATEPDIDRVVVDFGSTEGVVLSGINPSGDTLYFDSASKGAFARVPVNVRVSSPTMSFIEFGVSLVNGISGDLDVILSDGAGNNIAGFVLSYSGSEVGIHEFTENGKYPTPIYTFSKSSFSFAIEYSATKAAFNILIDGNYVAASSFTYSSGSARYGFEYLTLGCDESVGFTVQGLVCESIYGIFSTHSILAVSNDPVNGVYTFETSSFASLPSNIDRGLGDTTAHFKVVEGKICNAVSKVLEMNCGTGKSSSYSVFKKTQTLTGSNAVFVEADVMLTATTTALQMMFELQSSSGTAYALPISSANSSAGIALSVDGTSVTVKEGEWFRLRVEYRDAPHDFDYDGLNDVVVRIYVNGEMVKESHTPYSKTSVIRSSYITKFRVRNASGRAGVCSLDNLVFGELNMSYTPPAPPDTDTLTYEPGVVTGLTKATLGKTTSSLKISSLNVSGEITKVLDFYTSSSSYDEVSISSTLKETGVNAVMFETDIMIDPVSDIANLYLVPKTQRGNQPIRFALTATKNGDVVMYSVDNNGVIDPTISDGIVIGQSGKWLKLKIEYMNPRVDYTGDGIDDILCRIYVDGILVNALYNPYEPGGFYNPKDISRIVLSATADTEARICLDNTRFWLINLEADEAPEVEPDITLGENESQNGGFDYDGWS